MAKQKAIQISLDKDLIERVDKVRNKLRYTPSRSSLISVALEAELKLHEKKDCSSDRNEIG